MGIRNGQQFLELLHDCRLLWIDGELVKVLTMDHGFYGAAYTMAE